MHMYQSDPIILDFGIAKVAHENEYMTRCCGTYQWMAP